MQLPKNSYKKIEITKFAIKSKSSLPNTQGLEAATGLDVAQTQNHIEISTSLYIFLQQSVMALVLDK